MLREIIERLRALWPGYEAQLVRDYRNAFGNRDGVLRDIAMFAKYNQTASSDELERIEGRREVFRHIMAMRGIDPALIPQFLEGELID
jgi:hypothetical protein